MTLSDKISITKRQSLTQLLKIVSTIFKRQMYFFVISNKVHRREI